MNIVERHNLKKSEEMEPGKIHLSENLAYQDKVENIEEMKTSIFLNTYRNAALSVVKIIESSDDRISNDYNYEDVNYNKFDKYDKYEMKNYSNNIVAFVGDRGTGKSSAMKSFTKAIIEEKLGDVVEEFKTDKKFYTLPIIDPSQLTQNEGILESIIANMYLEVSEVLDNSRDRRQYLDIYMDDIHEVLDQFERTYASLKYYRNEAARKWNDDSDTALEKLERLSSSKKLRTDIKNLIRIFLRLKSGHNRKNKDWNDYMLIIPIDDLDMNIENGFEIAEEIRKFLMIPNVIILMALNINQFSQLVQREYLLKYEIMKRNNYVSEEIRSTAEKYVTKFLPTNRRSMMPLLSLTGASSYAVVYEDKTIEIKEKLTDYFLKQIYKKTGILLLKNSIESHEIIPDNLRDLHQLYALLKDMEDVDLYACLNEENVVEKSKLGLNLHMFSNYLLNSYFLKLDINEKLFIVREFDNVDSSHINKYILDKIVVNNRTEEKGFVLPKLAENYSIGDVLRRLSELNEEDTSSSTRKFVEGIKILYSIRLIKLLFVNQNRAEARIIIGKLLYDDKFDLNFLNDKDVDVVDSSYWTSNYFAQFFVSYFNRDEFLNNLYVPLYKSGYIPGATKKLTLNYSSFIVNLLDLQLIEDRNTRHKFNDEEVQKIKEWSSKYITALPVWSLDFIEEFFGRFNRIYDLSSKEKKIDISDKIKDIFKTYVKVLESIIKDNAFVNLIEIKSREESLGNILKKSLNIIADRGYENYFGKFDFILMLGQAIEKKSWEVNNENWELPIEAQLLADDLLDIVEPMLKNDIKELNGRKPRYIKIGEDVIPVRRWNELLVKTISYLINNDPTKFQILAAEIKELHMGFEEKIEKQSRKVLNLSDSVLSKPVYIKTNFNANMTIELCKRAFETLNKNYEDFEVYCLKE